MKSRYEEIIIKVDDEERKVYKYGVEVYDKFDMFIDCKFFKTKAERNKLYNKLLK